MNKQGTGNRGQGKGFSLIEILVAVLILALGLLGIAAVFPVVLREQRIGTENIMGVVVSNSARAALLSTDWNGTDWSGLINPAPARPWAELRARVLSTGGVGPTQNGMGQDYERGEWYAFNLPDPPPPGEEGTIVVGDPADVNDQVKIPVRSRLYPIESAPAQSPQFVWDIAVHRISDFDPTTGVGPDSTYSGDRLQMAVFVRRVDTRIRFTRGDDRSLLRTFVDRNLASTEWRLPVGVDAQGLPTLDGTDGNGGVQYARPMKSELQFYYDPSNPLIRFPDRLYVPTTVTAQTWALLRQPNQRIIDNMGNVYTVIRDEVTTFGPGRYLKVSPEVPASVQAEAQRSPGFLSQMLIEGVFTPQVPVSIIVMEVPE